jgi:hypothetical protein
MLPDGPLKNCRSFAWLQKKGKHWPLSAEDYLINSCGCLCSQLNYETKSVDFGWICLVWIGYDDDSTEIMSDYKGWWQMLEIVMNPSL